MGYAGRIDFRPQYRYLIFATDKEEDLRYFRAFRIDDLPDDDWTLFNLKSDRGMSILMFSKPSSYGSVAGEAADIGDIHFVCGYKYSIYYVVDNKEIAIENEKICGWSLDKEFTNEYGTLLVFRREVI